MNITTPSQIELRLLRSLRLKGYIVDMGTMNLSDRVRLLQRLVDKGFLVDSKDSIELTPLGIKVADTNFNIN